MKRLTTILLMFLSISLFAQDMGIYLKETRDMIKEDKYPEALDRCLWFHDYALEKQPAMKGVRLSFALRDWKSLADVYPPALTAMKETRDKKIEEINVNGGTKELVFRFHFTTTICSTIDVDSLPS